MSTCSSTSNILKICATGNPRNKSAVDTRSNAGLSTNRPTETLNTVPATTIQGGGPYTAAYGSPTMNDITVTDTGSDESFVLTGVLADMDTYSSLVTQPNGSLLWTSPVGDTVTIPAPDGAQTLTTTLVSVPTYFTAANVNAAGTFITQSSGPGSIFVSASTGSGENGGSGNRYTATFNTPNPMGTEYQVNLVATGELTAARPSALTPMVITKSPTGFTYAFYARDDSQPIDEIVLAAHSVTVTGGSISALATAAL